MTDENWRQAQKKLPLTIGKEYKIECIFSGIVEGIYSGHDSCDFFVEKKIGGYYLFIGDHKVWSGNIINIE